MIAGSVLLPALALYLVVAIAVAIWLRRTHPVGVAVRPSRWSSDIAAGLAWPVVLVVLVLFVVIDTAAPGDD